MVAVQNITIATLLLFISIQLGAAYATAPRADARSLFARDESNCPTLSCPQTPDCNCEEGTDCKLIVQTCTECAKIICKPRKKKGGASKGAIAGATLGGFAMAALLGFSAYRICMKKRKSRESMSATAAEKENDFGMLKSARASTHTVASIASTVRTRASNIIQIAYIPGVTNRSTPSTPAHLVPPVPPLPFTESPIGSQFPRSPGDIQFAADDLLRGSVYTVPDRSSVATTIYGGGAVVAQPNVVRAAGKAAVVQVKAGSSVASSNATSPAVPAIPPFFAAKNGNAKDSPPSPAFSVGSTFFNRMNSTSQKSECDSVVTENPPRRKVPGRAETIDENHSTYTCDSDITETEETARAAGNRDSKCSSCITDMETGSPFSDANSVIEVLPLPPNTGMPPAGNSRRLSMNLAGEKRTSAMPPPIERTVSPFDDANSVDKDKDSGKR